MFAAWKCPWADGLYLCPEREWTPDLAFKPGYARVLCTITGGVLPYRYDTHELSDSTSSLAAVAVTGIGTYIRLVIRAVASCGEHGCFSLLIDLVS